jgi:hypothetical protein
LLNLLLPLGAVVLVATSSWAAYGFVTERPDDAWDAPASWVHGWGLANVYHVFPTMQTQRHELVIEGSDDGRAWRPYRFRYKPNDPMDRPRFVVPLHPRLDWMMWFLPPQDPYMRRWFENFLWRLHTNSASVTALLEHNPFPSHGPRHLRALVFRYRFTTPQQRNASGATWQVEYLGEFPRVPPRRP